MKLGRVRSGEALVVALLIACMFFMLTGYYAMKTSREGLILARSAAGMSGQELKAYASAAMAGLWLAAVPAYGSLAARVRRIHLIDITYATVVGSLVVFFVLAKTGLAVGLPLFIWIGIVNLFLIAQFWSYAADLYTEDQGRRLFPIIALGGSFGAVAGPRLAAVASAESLLVIGATLLLPCIALFHVIERCHERDTSTNDLASRPIRGGSGFSLIWRDRYLGLIAGVVFFGALVKTIGEYVLSDAAAQHAAHIASAHDRQEAIKAFYGDFFFWVNVLSLAIQVFGVSYAIDKLGVRRAVLVMPLVALGAYSGIVFIGGFALLRAAKIAENSTEYSLDNTVHQAMFLSTERAAKYNAKTAIDTFAVRAGDTLSALVIWVGVRKVGLHGHELAVINLVLVACWLVVAALIARRARQRGASVPLLISDRHDASSDSRVPG
jgi:AAA family ATP:ADP antiporter